MPRRIPGGPVRGPGVRRDRRGRALPLSRPSVRDGRKRTPDVWVERRGRCRCPCCGSADVSACPGRERAVRGLMEGGCPTAVHVTPHLACCRACRARKTERIPFLSRPKARLTEALEKTVVALRGEMTVSAIAERCDLDRETVKDAEKRALARAYADMPPDAVTAVGINEIRAFPGARGAASQLITVARGLRTGDVPCVADGKGPEALRTFGERLAPFRDNVRFVCMDMSNAYGKWAREFLPGAEVEHGARLLFEDWCETERMTKTPELEAMARTIEAHLGGILGYWRHGGAGNASSEGFNTKIRRLTGQAYGLRDRECFRLKVFALPKQRPRNGM